MTAVRLPAVLDIRAAGHAPGRSAGPARVGRRPGRRRGGADRRPVPAGADRREEDLGPDGKALTWPPLSEALTEQLAAYGCADLNTDLVGATRMKTVLTVDDSRTMRDMLMHGPGGRRLSTSFRPRTASHGLETLKAHGADVIITDINMPRMDGFGFIEGVRADPDYRGTPDPGADHRKRRRQEAARPRCRGDRLDRQAVRSRQAGGRGPPRRGLSGSTT